MPRKSNNPDYEQKTIAAAKEVNDLLQARIRQLCKEQQITLAQLAKKSKVSFSTIRRIMNGQNNNVKSSTVFKIGWAFGLPPSKFLDARLLPQKKIF